MEYKSVSKMGTKEATTNLKGQQQAVNYTVPLIIIGALFFIFGFATWVNGTLIPYLEIVCELDDFQSTLVTFAFYISYVIMAIPSSMVIKATGYKKGMSLGLLIMSAGAFMFIPAATSRNYLLFLVGLFSIGVGLTLLQTASNPYVTILGPIDSAAKRISIMGICNKVAGMIGTFVLASLLFSSVNLLKEKLGDKKMGMDVLKQKIAQLPAADREMELTKLSSEVVTPYIVIGSILIVLAGCVLFSPLPEIDKKSDKETEETNLNSRPTIFNYPYLWLGVLALFAYVGAEVISIDYIVKYGNYLQLNSYFTENFLVACILVMIVIGNLLGSLLIPKFISQEKALAYCASLGIACSLGAMFSPGYISIGFIILLGLACSIIWPAIWPLSIKGLGKHTKTGSAMLIMAIAGGAVMPMLYGFLSKSVNAQSAYVILIPLFGIILFFALKGHKIGASSNN